MPKIKYCCEHCGEIHEIETRDIYNGKVLYSICPKTQRGVVIENK